MAVFHFIEGFYNPPGATRLSATYRPSSRSEEDAHEGMTDTHKTSMEAGQLQTSSSSSSSSRCAGRSACGGGQRVGRSASSASCCAALLRITRWVSESLVIMGSGSAPDLPGAASTSPAIRAQRGNAGISSSPTIRSEAARRQAKVAIILLLSAGHDIDRDAPPNAGSACCARDRTTSAGRQRAHRDIAPLRRGAAGLFPHAPQSFSAARAGYRRARRFPAAQTASRAPTQLALPHEGDVDRAYAAEVHAIPPFQRALVRKTIRNVVDALAWRQLDMEGVAGREHALAEMVRPQFGSRCGRGIEEEDRLVRIVEEGKGRIRPHPRCRRLGLGAVALAIAVVAAVAVAGAAPRCRACGAAAVPPTGRGPPLRASRPARGQEARHDPGQDAGRSPPRWVPTDREPASAPADAVTSFLPRMAALRSASSGKPARRVRAWAWPASAPMSYQ